MDIFRLKNIIVIFICITVFFHSFAFADRINFEEQLNSIFALNDPLLENKRLEQLLHQQGLPIQQKANAFHHIAINFYQLGELDLALQQMQKTQQFAKKNKLFEAEAQAHKLIGVYNYFKGTLKASLFSYKAALQYYQQQNEPIKQANLLNNIGLVYSAMGQYPQALEVYQQAQPLYNNFGSDVDRNDILANIAGLYLHLGLYKKALELFIKVKNKREELNDLEGLALTHSDIGLVYVKSGELDLAEKYTRLAYHYYVEQNRPYNVAAELNHLAELLNLAGRYDEAINYAKQCIISAKENAHIRALADCYSHLATAQFHHSELSSALKNLEKSNELALQEGIEVLQLKNINLNALILSNQGDFPAALDASNEFIKRKRELNNTLLYNTLARYESDQLKQQIEQLEQSTKLQQLAISKSHQQLVFTIIVTTLTLCLCVILYRRNSEKQIKIELAKKVELRTKELEELTVQLKKASNIKNQFLANMSHEIRTPLTAILGHSEAGVNGEFNHVSILQNMQVIHRNSEHLLQLVNDILDLSKIEAGKFTMSIHDVNLNRCLGEIEQTFTEPAAKKKLHFEVVHDLPESCFIKTDILRLKQILFNLCSNAIKFTRSGKVTMVVQIDTNSIRFSVEDTGIGIGTEQIDKIFNRFNQGDNDISRRFGGTGLGLFLSSQLAKLLSGQIEATSSLGKGSTFTLTIPYIQGSNTLKNAPQSPNQQLVLPKGIFTGKVLLADDYVDNRQLISHILQHLGFDVILAENGIEALYLYKKENPDLILLDIQMPEMDGFETLTHLNQLECKTPVYALTANAMAHEIDDYLKQGFLGHIQKPINRLELLNVLKTHFTMLQSQPGEESEKSSLLASEQATSTVNHEQLDSKDSHVDFSDLIELFKTELAKDLVIMNQCITDKNYQKVSNICHRISGAAAIFGFKDLGDVSKRIDTAGKLGNFDQVPDLINSLIIEINKIK